MKHCIIALLILTVLALCPSLFAQEGRLQKVRKEVESQDMPNGSERDRKRSDDDGAGEPQDDFGLMSLQALVAVGLAPFWFPHFAMDDDLHTYRYFTAYPYQAGYPGYVVPSPMGSAEWAQTWGSDIQPKAWAARLSLEDGNDFNGLNRLGGQALFETTPRLGVLFNWNWYHERLSCGCTDNTFIGDLNLTYRFAQCDWAEMRAGLGARVLTDQSLTDWGVNVHYGADVFPVRPLVLSAAVDVGNLGSAFVVHTRGTAGVLWRGWEIFGGYDFLRVGAVNLHGPLVGLRLWF